MDESEKSKERGLKYTEDDANKSGQQGGHKESEGNRKGKSSNQEARREEKKRKWRHRGGQ
eukprot:1367603-Amorphochlora_amoeboformis.AAC.2